MHLRVQRIACCVALVLGLVSAAMAGSIDLAWDAADGAWGYRVHFGPQAGVYTTTVDVGGATSVTVSGLTDCETSHVVVTAYNPAGESGYSNEVSSWPKPTISGTSPDSVMQGDQVSLTVTGNNLQSGADLEIDNPHVVLTGTTVVSCNEVQSAATVEPTAPGLRAAQIGSFQLKVSNPDGHQVTRGFEVLLDPARLDVNRSDATTAGRIDGRDTVWLSRNFGAREGDPLYDPDFDFDGNGWVDGIDLALIAANLGGCWTGSGWSVSACP